VCVDAATTSHFCGDIAVMMGLAQLIFLFYILPCIAFWLMHHLLMMLGL